MSTESDAREFLSSRRARVTPQQAGLPIYGGNRRVPGLRREEVALLAGVSVDYYNRLERGNLAGASDGVLDAIASALQLDEAERAHLHDLARAVGASPAARAPRKGADRVRPTVQRLADTMPSVPVVIRNQYFDYVGSNRLGRALYAPIFETRSPNSARFAFFEESARTFYPEWEQVVAELVATMRGEAGRNPYDRRLSDLVGELSTRSDIFRTLWGAHNVRYHQSGIKRLRHPIVGDLELVYEALELPADVGLTFNTYTTEPGSPSEDALRVLASWAATQELDAPELEPESERESESRER